MLERCGSPEQSPALAEVISDVQATLTLPEVEHALGPYLPALQVAAQQLFTPPVVDSTIQAPPTLRLDNHIPVIDLSGRQSYGIDEPYASLAPYQKPHLARQLLGLTDLPLNPAHLQRIIATLDTKLHEHHSSGQLGPQLYKTADRSGCVTRQVATFTLGTRLFPKAEERAFDLLGRPILGLVLDTMTSPGRRNYYLLHELVHVLQNWAEPLVSLETLHDTSLRWELEAYGIAYAYAATLYDGSDERYRHDKSMLYGIDVIEVLQDYGDPKDIFAPTAAVKAALERRGVDIIRDN